MEMKERRDKERRKKETKGGTLIDRKRGEERRIKEV